MGMIEDLLDVARSRQGRGLPVEPKPSDLAAVAQAVLNEQRMVFPERAVEFASTGQLEGRWDAARLHQLLANLLGNALRHGDAAQPVSLVLDGESAHHVGVLVANGGAIPDDMQDTLFDPFHGDHRSRTRHGGLGLGLYICREIVAAHGGVIEVQSAPATGTRIGVTLPRNTPE
jgi:signal transduction histidine kinase